MSMVALLGRPEHVVQLWTTTGFRVGESFVHPAAVTEQSLSPDGQRFVTGCADGIARVWDIPRIVPNRHASGRAVGGYAVSVPRTVEVPGEIIQIYSVTGTRTDVNVREYILGSEFPIAIAESGARVAYPRSMLPGPRPAVRVCWADGRKPLSLPIREPTFIVDNDRARALAFCQTPNDAVAVALGGDMVYVVEMDSGRSRDVPIAGVPVGWGLTALQASPTGTTLAVGGPIGAVAVWDCLTGSLRDLPIPDKGKACSLSFSSDGRYLAGVFVVERPHIHDTLSEGWVGVWELNSSASPRYARLCGRSGKILGFSPAQQTILTVSGGAIEEWDLLTMTRLGRAWQWYDGAVMVLDQRTGVVHDWAPAGWVPLRQPTAPLGRKGLGLEQYVGWMTALKPGPSGSWVRLSQAEWIAQGTGTEFDPGVVPPK
jgi:hypothetical protein